MGSPRAARGFFSLRRELRRALAKSLQCRRALASLVPARSETAHTLRKLFGAHASACGVVLGRGGAGLARAADVKRGVLGPGSRAPCVEFTEEHRRERAMLVRSVTRLADVIRQIVELDVIRLYGRRRRAESETRTREHAVRARAECEPRERERARETAIRALLPASALPRAPRESAAA